MEAELAALTARLASKAIAAEGAIDQATARLAQAQLARLPAPPAPAAAAAAGAPSTPAAPADDPIQQRINREASLAHAVAVATVEVATRQVAAATADAAAAAEREQVEVDVDAARAEADLSLARAGAATTVAEAKVRTALAALQAQIADALESEQRRNLDREAALRALADEVEAGRVEGEEAVAMTPLAAGRGGRIDAAPRLNNAERELDHALQLLTVAKVERRRCGSKRRVAPATRSSAASTASCGERSPKHR